MTTATKAKPSKKNKSLRKAKTKTKAKVKKSKAAVKKRVKAKSTKKLPRKSTVLLLLLWSSSSLTRPKGHHLQLIYDKNFSGFTGLPSRRISKCNMTLPVLSRPISAICCPALTLVPSLTRSRLLNA